PVTPLGRDVLRALCAAWDNLTGGRVTHDTQAMLLVAGERLFVNVNDVLGGQLVRRLGRKALALADPGLAPALEEVLRDPGLAPRLPRVSLRRLACGARMFALMLGQVLSFLLWPDVRRRLFRSRIDALIAA